MRHRRRNNTQTILRQTTGTYTKFNSPKKKKSKKPLFYFLLLIVVFSIGYSYSDYLNKLYNDITKSSLSEDTAQQTDESTHSESQAIPAQQDNVKDIYYSPIEKRIQLEILNGCGETGVAKKLSDLLKKSNYDIVNSGNYIQKGKINWDVNESKIIDQIDRQSEARKLADIMGILYSNVETFDNPSPIADLTIVIGKDYKTLAIFQ